MQKIKFLLIRSILLGMAVPLLFGVSCSSSVPARLYVLRPTDVPRTGDVQVAEAPTATTSKKALSLKLGVLPVDLPGYLDRSQIVREVNPNQLSLANLDEWAEPLKENVTRLLNEDLIRALGSSHVYSFPADDDVQITHKLAVRIVRFEPSTSGDVILEARWSVTSIKDRKEVVSRYSVVREPVLREVAPSPATEFPRGVPPESSYKSEVAALNAALAKLGHEIADVCAAL